MKPTAYDGTTTSGTQAWKKYDIDEKGWYSSIYNPIFPGYIWNRQHMMVQPLQAHKHGKNMTSMRKVDTLRFELQI